MTSNRALVILDWILRITGVVGLISFADNLQTWREWFTQIGLWFRSIDWLSFVVFSFDLLRTVYDFIAGTVFGWIEDEMLRDSMMLATSIGGIFVVQQFIRNTRPIRSITFFMLAATAIYLFGHYPYDLFGQCSDERLILALIIGPVLMMISAQFVRHVYTTPGARKPGASPMAIHEKVYWSVVPIVAVAGWTCILGIDMIEHVRLAQASKECS